MIFAAGLGTRMGDLVSDRPKPMIPVAGRPLIDHALEIARQADVAKIVVNTHYKAKILTDHIRNSHAEISHESPTLLETGGGLRNALPLLGTDPVFTLNSDAVWAGPNPINQLAAAWNPETMDALLLLIRPECAFGHTGPGDFSAPDNDRQIVRGPGLIYSGAQIIQTQDLNTVPEVAFSLNVIWDLFLARRRLCAIVYDGKWCDVGKPRGIADAENMLTDHANV